MNRPVKKVNLQKNCTKKNTTKQYKYNTKPENLIKSEKNADLCSKKISNNY